MNELDRISTDLTIETLARAIHEDACAALRKYGIRPVINVGIRKGPDKWIETPNFDELDVVHRKIRYEQARLMFERIMR